MRGTRQGGYITPTSLADQVFDPSSGSTARTLAKPASGGLAPCTRAGCHMNECIVTNSTCDEGLVADHAAAQGFRKASRGLPQAPLEVLHHAAQQMNLLRPCWKV